MQQSCSIILWIKGGLAFTNFAESFWLRCLSLSYCPSNTQQHGICFQCTLKALPKPVSSSVKHLSLYLQNNFEAFAIHLHHIHQHSRNALKCIRENFRRGAWISQNMTSNPLPGWALLINTRLEDLTLQAQRNTHREATAKAVSPDRLNYWRFQNLQNQLRDSGFIPKYIPSTSAV